MADNKNDLYQQHNIEEYFVEDEPYYLPVGDEIEIFEAAYAQRVPILLKGPTGSGKTRFVEHMSWRLNDTRKKDNKEIPISPLVTVACHEDLTASDLVGRYLLEPEGTRWIDGPLTRAVKYGGICYLDEVVEARKDTTVLIHPLADHRRLLHIEKIGEVLESHPNFLLVISYNPGYQSALKDLKHSTRQRFVAIEFDFPPKELEGPIIEHESTVDSAIASQLALLGEKIRNLVGQGLQEGVSTRLLIYAGKLIQQGIAPRRACEVAVVWGLTDDHETQASVMEIVTSIFP
ncbi:MAG: AAA family ATPase [Chloroflexi bacterium]|nr:AAA family ATPase [Chloroflexota bacterium]|tara:strand:- start:4688 stop:5557 length:870 start_codon:yes stop_codon:yes gene_type:complete